MKEIDAYEKMQKRIEFSCKYCYKAYRKARTFPTAGALKVHQRNPKCAIYHVDKTSVDTLRTINGIVYQTFQEAVVACGLVTDQNKVITCFMDILYISKPSEKRSLFLVLTLQVLTLTKYD